jgi:hypothetical protein
LVLQLTSSSAHGRAYQNLLVSSNAPIEQSWLPSTMHLHQPDRNDGSEINQSWPPSTVQTDSQSDFSDSDLRKVSFLTKADEANDTFIEPVRLPKDVENAIRWCASRSHEEAARAREKVTQRIERIAEMCLKSERKSEWLKNVNAAIKGNVSTVAGPLLEELAKMIEHEDVDSVNTLRFGAPLYEKLKFTGNGVEVELDDPMPVEQLKSQLEVNNRHLLNNMREDALQVSFSSRPLATSSGVGLLKRST